MGAFSIFHLSLPLFLTLILAFLPLIIKRPVGRALYGAPPPTGLDMAAAIRTCFNKYADFNGRASRSEFWWFRLFVVLACIGLFVIAKVTGLGFIRFGGLALFLPDLAAAVRRLHDNNRSGWWLLLAYTPGVIPVIYMLCQPSWKDDRDASRVFE